MVSGFEVVGEKVQEGSWELLWCSLRVSKGPFAGRQEHTSAHGWCLLAPLLLLLLEVMVGLNPGEQNLPGDSGC